MVISEIRLVLFLHWGTKPVTSAVLPKSCSMIGWLSDCLCSGTNLTVCLSAYRAVKNSSMHQSSFCLLADLWKLSLPCVMADSHWPSPTPTPTPKAAPCTSIVSVSKKSFQSKANDPFANRSRSQAGDSGGVTQVNMLEQCEGGGWSSSEQAWTGLDLSHWDLPW